MEQLEPRNLHPVPAQPGYYLRPGHNDHTSLSQLISEERLVASGIVIDARRMDRHESLIVDASSAGIETILDSRSFELATPRAAGDSGLQALPWAQGSPHSPADLASPRGRAFGQRMAEQIATRNFTAALAPSHYLDPDSLDWIDVDAALTTWLRGALDTNGLKSVPIYYPLIIHTKILSDSAMRDRLIERLRGLPIDALWLRVHPFGTATSGPQSLRNYITACRHLHDLGVPIVAERTGTVGVALLAFGAVGGVEGGITYGERFDARDWTHPRIGGDPFAPPPRVYINGIGAFLSRAQARSLFEFRGMQSALGCTDAGCCRRGVKDTLLDPRRHFILQRGGEIQQLGRTPAALRSGTYMETFLRPASDRAARSAAVLPELQAQRRRLDSWRGTLGTVQEDMLRRDVTFSAVPEGHRLSAS